MLPLLFAWLRCAGPYSRRRAPRRVGDGRDGVQPCSRFWKPGASQQQILSPRPPSLALSTPILKRVDWGGVADSFFPISIFFLAVRGWTPLPPLESLRKARVVRCRLRVPMHSGQSVARAFSRRVGRRVGQELSPGVFQWCFTLHYFGPTVRANNTKSPTCLSRAHLNQGTGMPSLISIDVH